MRVKKPGGAPRGKATARPDPRQAGGYMVLLLLLGLFLGLFAGRVKNLCGLAALIAVIHADNAFLAARDDDLTVATGADGIDKVRAAREAAHVIAAGVPHLDGHIARRGNEVAAL